MIIEKNSKRPCLIVGVLYCKFIALLYRCNETVLVSITIWFQTRDTRKFNESYGVRVGRNVKNHWLIITTFQNIFLHLDNIPINLVYMDPENIYSKVPMSGAFNMNEHRVKCDTLCFDTSSSSVESWSVFVFLHLNFSLKNDSKTVNKPHNLLLRFLWILLHFFVDNWHCNKLSAKEIQTWHIRSSVLRFTVSTTCAQNLKTMWA